MITTIFSKSRPFNYILVTALLILCFFLYQLKDVASIDTGMEIATKGMLLLVLIASLFISNFITKKNGLSKDNTFPFLFFFSFLILFPTTLGTSTLIISNFFVLLALRRLISLQSLVTPKEKIFDASLWIFIASLFHFWSILFIILVFVSIILHVARDYRNWVLPYIAFFTVAIIFLLFAFIFDKTLVYNLLEKAYISFDFNYFTNKFQNIALSIYVAITALFLFTQILTLPSKPLIHHNSYKKIIIAFFIGFAVYVVSPDKNNSILIYTFMPLAVMATGYFEVNQTNWTKEATAILVVGLSFLSFFLQL
ncbi:hypothetical protein J2X31_002760 [Flavobacterium arsenatis]|uniref:Beta-carotene 15,15'-monooxygenase n=1 Tax=Flavobacterium arsenatis TaxID=1484332 RepID=A0ABU1TSA0_9FLAO|nr:hypothetical protein [Flavobacterium arsenatis]MDR6968734.1 hypothetical protein [Flavobacterium arsenatis]